MTRPNRLFVQGGIYHVYNRLGRGERVFDDAREAAAFVAVLRDVVTRDGLTVLAWCLMSNHYHLAVRTGVITLDRPLRSLQQRVTRAVNHRRDVAGALWQGRYKAKLVRDSQHLEAVIAYIHLNPFTAGLVSDPAEHRWSGHAELLGRARQPIVAVDEVLQMFGSSRRSGRAEYVRRLQARGEADWAGAAPGQLPWWRSGRPSKESSEDSPLVGQESVAPAGSGPALRPELGADEFVARAAAGLGVDVDALRSRSRRTQLVQARELTLVLGVERYGLRVKDLAHQLRKSADGMTQATARAVRKRTTDSGFRADLDLLDRKVSACREDG